MSPKPTERFSNRAEDYRRYRPGYPAAVTELMRRECGLKFGAEVADIGSGTGIFSRVLLAAGFAVTAVEPNAAMRGIAEEDLGSLSGFRSVAAPAEHTGLPDASFDAITVAQAFHWFDRPAALAEFRRLLRPRGWLLLIWNDRRVDSNNLARGYEDLLKSLGRAYESVRRRNEEAENMGAEDFLAGGSGLLAQFDNPQVMNWPGLRGRLLSASYFPAKGEPRHDELLAEMERIFHANAENGHVTFDQVTKVYYGPMR